MIQNLLILVAGFCLLACASDNNPQYSRSGRMQEQSRAMNHRNLDSESLYQACLRERDEISCRNRLGR